MPDRIRRHQEDMRAAHGDIDEVVVTGCDVHLEQMSETLFCLILTRGGEEMRIVIFKKGRGVRAIATIDAGFKDLEAGDD